MSTIVWPKTPSFVFKDGVSTPDANNQLTVVFTVYDYNNKEYHFTRKQNISIAYDGNFDVFTTAKWINQNLQTCDTQVKQGILTEAQTDEAIAAVQEEAAKKAAEAHEEQEATTSNSSNSSSTNTSSTSDSTNTNGSV